MEPEKKSNGAFIGLIIIIIILVIGGIYVWQQPSTTVAPASPVIENSEAVTEEDSSELDSLQADVNSADIGGDLDTETVN